MIPALLAVAIVAAGFATLMVRLEVTQEGYRLSALRLEMRNLEDENQRLKLEVGRTFFTCTSARAGAPNTGCGPPAPGHVVMMP